MTLVKFNNRNTRTIDPWINGIFDSFFNDSSTLEKFNAQVAKATPMVNISESEQGFEIEVVVPGLKKEDFKINLEKLSLTISLEREEEKEIEGKRYSKREYYVESFSRSFTLPENIDSEKISAEYVDGILKVFISKKEEEKEKVRVINVR